MFLIFVLTLQPVAGITLVIMRGMQGIGAAAMIPASVGPLLVIDLPARKNYNLSAWYSIEGIPVWALALHCLCNLLRGRSNRISLQHRSQQYPHTVDQVRVNICTYVPVFV